MKSLSILIPTFNDECAGLVKALQGQAVGIGGLDFEIIVADDGSTDKEVVRKNGEIERMTNCRYIINRVNRGRAAIRNQLASVARCDYVLFIDGDMVVNRADYIRKYVDLDGVDVVYGGYVVGGDKRLLRGNLRFAYESKYGGNANADLRNARPYEDFHTSNFMAKRSIMTAHPFDERFRRYGYEDVIWGKSLRQASIGISHIDNPLSFERFEDNASFLAKTEEGLRTLHAFEDELQGYSSIIECAARLRTLHIDGLLAVIFNVFKGGIRCNLMGGKPSVLLFNIYKLGTFLELCRR